MKKSRRRVSRKVKKELKKIILNSGIDKAWKSKHLKIYIKITKGVKRITMYKKYTVVAYSLGV